MRTRAGAAARERLRAYADDVYLHQVAVRRGGEQPEFHRDLDAALATPLRVGDDWRVHFHVPLHAAGDGMLGTTADTLPGVLDWLAADPTRCSHLEMETYTWEVFPPELRAGSVAEQIVREYAWTLDLLQARGLA